MRLVRYLLATAVLLVVAGCTTSDRVSAKKACEGYVMAELASPSSAVFSGEDLAESGSTYVLNGTVDSDDLSGLRISDGFECTVSKDGGHWTLVSLDGPTDYRPDADIHPPFLLARLVFV